MWLWGLTIDSVAIINLVLAVGLAVDYSAHVAHAFVVARGTHQERMVTAVTEMGTAVIHGAASTFVAVLVLAASNSYIFRIFFKQFFGICLFGVAHGMVLLPVLLSLIGPPEQLTHLESTPTPTKGAGGDLALSGISVPPSPPPSAPASNRSSGASRRVAA